ncbi:MAG TPA: alpha/beta hydrolase [Syntrophomonadaceae bacterium]|nr:alpha/beta hydrolase [Syntrophomonadaceae bacterium]HOQ09828.1 alpha/beta hydrolase [Syntrophomonadaceae bacterium]HPU48848.1 alpha/beta hydrolase [Syntrophomonadaceae bacterium]
MQQITIVNRRQLKLAALLNLPENCSGLVISCHGFRGAKENRGRIYSLSSKLNSIGLGLLAFDFQGSGQSEGTYHDITLTRQAGDLQDVIDFAARQFNMPLVLLGRSFGGSTVLAGASQDARVTGYIFWSTPVFLKETFAAMDPALAGQLEQGKTITLVDEGGSYQLAPDLLLDFANHNMDEYIKAIGNRPVLIIHGQSDEIVAPENALYLARHLSDCQLHLVEGADHRFSQHGDQREDLTIDWLVRHWKAKQ